MSWTWIQSANGNNGGGSASSSTTATFATANISAGSKIIAYVTADAGAAVTCTGVADGASNAWTKIGSITATTGFNGEASIWALDAPAGDVGTKPAITATLSRNCDAAILVQEVSGLAAGNTTAMCDGSPATLTGQTSSTGSPSYSTSAAGEFLVSLYGDFGDAFTIATAPGWTPDPGNRNTSGTVSLMQQYKNSAGGAETGGYTSADTTSGWEIITVAFRLAGAAAGPAGTAPAHMVVARRPPARGTWRGVTARTVNAAAPGAVNGSQPGGIVRRRAAARGTWGGQSTPQPHVPGSIQPRATVAVPRRAVARAWWDSGTGPANAHGPSGTTQPRAAAPLPRRYPARAVWRGGTSAAFLNGTVQPRASVPVSRRYATRALWRSEPGAGNAHGPSGFTQPRAAVPVPRRAAARAVWDSAAGPANAHGPGGLPSPHLTIPRRVPARATWRGFVSSTVNHSASPLGVQAWMPHPSVSRRAPARAVQAGTVSRTVNAIPPVPGTAQHPAVPRRAAARAVVRGGPAPFPPPSGTVQPAATAPVRRHVPARIIWHGGPVPGRQPRPATGGIARRRAAARGQWHAGTGAPPPATASGTPAAGKSVTTRRPPARGTWRGVTARTVNAIPPAVPAPKPRAGLPRRAAARAMWRGAAGQVRPALPVRFSVPSARQLWSVPDARQLWSVPDARNSSS